MLPNGHVGYPFIGSTHADSVANTSSEDADLFVSDLATQITFLSAQPSNVLGYFSDLFAALHATEGMVTLKRLRISSWRPIPRAVKQFLRKASTNWIAARHPNVLRFLGACRIDGSIYLVSPYMRNGNIMTFIRNHPQRADRIRLIVDIAAGLEFLHSQNVIHGNMKGSNILISNQEHALLCDYGLHGMDYIYTDTSSQRGVGSSRWQAPELWVDAPMSFKTDMYAFAMTITEILSGDVPLRQYIDNFGVVSAVLLSDARPLMEPTSSSEGVSCEWIWSVAAMCWHKDPDERPLMSRVTWLLDCRRAVSVPPVGPHPNHPIGSFLTVAQCSAPYASPQDPFSLLSLNILSNILRLLSLEELVAGSRVCKLWNICINGDPVIWTVKLKEAGLWCGGVPEAAWARRCFNLRAKHRASVDNQSLPHPHKTLFKLRLTTRNRWTLNIPRETRVPVAGGVAGPHRLFRGRIISVSRDYKISLHSYPNSDDVRFLEGHSDCITAFDICSRRRRIPTSPIDDQVDGHRPKPQSHDVLVSGSWDGTVRIWDLQIQRNTHTFTGHRGGVECVAIARPVWVVADDGSGVLQKWPRHHMLVSGDRGGALMMWRVPGPNIPEYDGEEWNENALKNPYYVETLVGHANAVTAIAVHGRTIASGSRDNAVRIWDLVTGECKHTLIGHPKGVDAVALDPVRKWVFSASSGSIRIWSLDNGSTLGALADPIPGLTSEISLSTNALISRSVDGSLTSWDLANIDAPAHVFHNADDDPECGCYSFFRHNDDKIIHCFGRKLNLWNTRDGTLVRQMITDGYIEGVAFDRRYCVATVTNPDTYDGYLHIWDFAGDREAKEKLEAGGNENGDSYDENCLAEEDVEFSDSEEGEGWE